MTAKTIPRKKMLFLRDDIYTFTVGIKHVWGVPLRFGVVRRVSGKEFFSTVN